MAEVDAVTVEAERETATDPVCGMSVPLHAGKPTADHDGEVYHFCREGCRDKFVADPERYLSGAEPEPMPEGTLYTCPMDPEIIQEGPGTCPICGMALEPMGIPPVDTENPELIDFTRRLKIAAIPALALLVLEMGQHLTGIDFCPSWISVPSSGCSSFWRFLSCSTAVFRSSSAA